MGNVVTLATSEQSAIDTDQVQRLKRELGEKRCRTIVDGMIFEITDALCKIEIHANAEEFDLMSDPIDRVFEISDQLGLVCLTDVAADLNIAISGNDLPAIIAVASRLIRLSEDSLFSLIEFTDRNII